MKIDNNEKNIFRPSVTNNKILQNHEMLQVTTRKSHN